MVYAGTERTVFCGKWWLWMVMPGPPGGTRRGRPREEVEWMRRVSLMVLWRLLCCGGSQSGLGLRGGGERGKGRGKGVLGRKGKEKW